MILNLETPTGSGPVDSALGDATGSHSGAALSAQACQLRTLTPFTDLREVTGALDALRSACKSSKRPSSSGQSPRGTRIWPAPCRGSCPRRHRTRRLRDEIALYVAFDEGAVTDRRRVVRALRDFAVLGDLDHQALRWIRETERTRMGLSQGNPGSSLRSTAFAPAHPSAAVPCVYLATGSARIDKGSLIPLKLRNSRPRLGLRLSGRIQRNPPRQIGESASLTPRPNERW
jgi:hypothetical protein